MGDMSALDLANVAKDILNTKLPLYKTRAALTQETNTLEAKIAGPFYGVRVFGLCLA